MTKRTWWTRTYWHPAERDLLLYVNGEGGAKLVRRVRDHLEGCWSCSMKRDRLSSAIAAFMRARESGLDGECLSEGADRRFASRLQRLAQKSASDRIASRSKNPGRTPRRVRLQAIVAVSVFAAIAVLLWLRFSSVPSVSAREILSHVEQAEATRLGAVNEPVIHQLLHITRRANGRLPESTYLETWRDTRKNRWRQEAKEVASAAGGSSSKEVSFRSKFRERSDAADHPVVTELQEVLKVNDMQQNPMSVSAFAGWRAKLKNPVESIAETLLETGERALVITTAAAEPLSKNSITKAEFVVRRQDWHPVEQRLNVFEPDGFRSYEIRETSFEVVALSSLGASIFEPAVVPSLAVQTSFPDTTLAGRSDVDAWELEVALFYRLHQADACEEIEVVRRAPGKPEIRGVVGSSQRKQELTRLLAAFPDVSVVIQSPADDEKAGLPEVPGSSQETVVEAATNGANENNGAFLRDRLVAYFARQDIPPAAQRTRVIEFSNQVISSSQAAHLHAWALHRLVKQFESAPLARISPQTLAAFRSMVQDHLGALGDEVRRCDEMLRPVLVSVANSENVATLPATQPGNWQTRSMRIFEFVMNADRLIQGLLTGAEGTVNSHESNSELLATLSRILEEVRGAESQLSSLDTVSEPQVSLPNSVQRAKR